MDEATDPFAELTRRGHLLFAAAVQAWEQAARSMVDAAARPDRRPPDIRPSMEAAFDFAAQMLADQQEFARALMSLGAQASPATGERPAPGAGPAPTAEAGTGADGRHSSGRTPIGPAAASSADEPATPEATKAPTEQARPQRKATAQRKAAGQRKAAAQKRTPTTGT